MLYTLPKELSVAPVKQYRTMHPAPRPSPGFTLAFLLLHRFPYISCLYNLRTTVDSSTAVVDAGVGLAVAICTKDGAT